MWWEKSAPLIGIGLIYRTKVGGDQAPLSPKVPAALISDLQSPPCGFSTDKLCCSTLKVTLIMELKR